ncbi:MAG TPA: transglycosylase SLT domain-containing protein [Terriglobia bacterium]|nr:transglycosylase SLT domain-containing protein [Terriglobia bacterium]
MKLILSLLVSFFFPLASTVQVPAASPQRLPSTLVHLAARANSSSAWPELRRYAESLKPGKDRALAYFVLGYREYESGEYDAAAADLAKASSPASPLADLADYYRASAAYKGGHPEAVPGILGGFNQRYPSSTEHYDAIELMAWAYLQTGDPEKALQLLQSEHQVRERPALALVLGRAYTNTGQLRQAAQTFQDIYYAFPTTPQAGAAGDALDKLKSQLGVSYPPVSDEIASARLEKLYSASRYAEALKGYDQLMKDRRNSAWAWRWNLGRARCLIRLGRASDAAETLVNSIAPTPELDAERLATLVDAYARIEDDTAVARTLNKLRADHFNSHWHTVALLRAANYFMYRGEWDIAPLYYRTLQDAFPKTPQASEASWRSAWISCLTGKSGEAGKALRDHIQKYPGSSHVPAALYFLGRLAEDGQPAEARALYQFLMTRYRHGYYALQASNRLPLLKKRPVEQTVSGDGYLFSLRELAGKIPSADPPGFGACPPSNSAENLSGFNTLKALHLDDLAKQDLQARLARHPDSPALIIAFSKFEAEQGRTERALHLTKRITPDYYSQQFSELPREVWQLLFPMAHITVIRRYAAINHLDPYLVMALIRQESGFNPRATSTSDARGLMQVVASTVTHSKRYLNSVGRRLYEPAYNVRFGCAFLSRLIKRYNGNTAAALAAYNAGPTAVDQWLSQRKYRDQQEFVESIPFPETRVYLKAVFADSGVYRQLLRGTATFAECSSNHTKARERPTAGLPRNLQSQYRPMLSNVTISVLH